MTRRLWAWVFFLSEWAIRVIMLATVPFRRTPAAAKGWLLLIFFEPWIGLAVYLLIGRATLPRLAAPSGFPDCPQVMGKVLERLANHPNVFHPRLAPSSPRRSCSPRTWARCPCWAATRPRSWWTTTRVLDRLVADIDRAEHHVHLLFYIFADDRATAPVIAALGRASRRGVRCRVLVDSVGSRSALSTLIPKLTASGVAVREMLPVGLFRWRSARLDLRNHRKIAVIDGRVAYTGSQNLVAAEFKEGITYEELMLRVTGPAVWDLQYIFAADWFLETDEVLDCDEVFPDLGDRGDRPHPGAAERARTFPPRTTSGSSWP